MKQEIVGNAALSVPKKLLSIILLIFMLFSITAGIDFSAYADGFTPRLSSPSKTGYYAAYDNNCCTYAKCRASEILGYNVYIGNNGPGGYYDYCKSTGAFPVGTMPKVGALAVASGHIFVIEEINGSTLTISEGHSYTEVSGSSYFNIDYGRDKGATDGTWFDNRKITYNTSTGVPNSNVIGTWKGYIYIYNGSTGTTAKGEMTVPTISLSQGIYYVGDTVNISWSKTSSDTDFYQYWLIIKNITTNSEADAGDAGSTNNPDKNYYPFRIKTSGQYMITVYAVPINNKNSRQKVATAYFTANTTEMKIPNISMNKANYSVNDTAKITWAATSSNSDFCHYWLIVRNKTTGTQIFGGDPDSLNNPEKNFYSFRIPSAGQYKIDVYAVPYYNKDSRQKSSTISICVHGYTNNCDTTCDYCGATRTVTHAYDNGKITKQPTCTSTGTKTYTCNVCGVTKTSSISAKGHSYDEGKVTWHPTCTEEGTKVYTCTSCGMTNSETIPATGHTVVTDKAVKATYAKTGKTEGKHCKTCGEVIVAQKTVKKLTVPKITLSSVKSKKSKQIAVVWKKNTKVTGYQVQYATNSKFTKNKKTVTISKNSTTSKTISKLKGKTKYYVRVRAYKIENGKKYYSAWSSTKSVTTKK